ncbi:MAG: hypothetical protein ACD_49C00064G0004 [uncultured bacterium (gcode 4)]|uniref:Nucleoside diphosphate kinase-like domain-containing protein n=1 Tax=uncultured bacterium (gcode 4) TaxID=1234023 RepID=K2AWN2_9BACT|nr:MAG: hypothetical protein ACD_49C00064G0004 [uncultured bacterium (gcode 4)]
METNLINKINDAINSGKTEVMIAPFEFSNEKQNEFLIFFKPEVFFWGADKAESIISMAFDKFSANNVDISGILLLTWDRLNELAIMDRHYGFINKLSKSASKILTSDELEKIYSLLEITDRENYKIYGWHEFLASHPDFSEESLDEFWATKKSAKIKWGFYIQKFELNWEKFVLVDAFHPAQLKHFINPPHKILVLLARSDNNWDSLRDIMIWDTFPEKAVSESIRWELYANKENYGMKEVNIWNNGIHMSAGPFEAIFEINNFLKDISNSAYSPEKTNLYNKMITSGITASDALNSLSNPTINIDGKETWIFDISEIKNSSDAIEIYKNKYL